MRAIDSRTLMLALRAWLDEDDGERNAGQIAEYVIEKAIAGHFGYFKLVFDLVDGKLRPTADEEMTGDDAAMPVAAAPDAIREVTWAA